MCGGGGKGPVGNLFGGAGKALSAVGGLVTGPKAPKPIPPPVRTDPNVAAAKKRLRQSERLRRGRAASIIADPEETLGAPPVSRPTATTQQLG